MTPEAWRDRLSLSYLPSVYQAGLFDFVDVGEGNGMAVAVAGAGKSTSLTAAVKIALDRTKYVLALAFNREAKDQLVKKLEGTGARVKTVHGHGFAAISFTFGWGKVEVVEDKYRNLVDRYIAEFDAAQTLAGDDCSPAEVKAIIDDGFPRASILKLLDLARLDLLDAFADNFGAELRRIAQHHNVDVDPALGQLVTDVVRLAMKWGANNPKIIDYTDMVWLPTVLGLRPWTADWVFVDEAQDISKAHRALIRASIKPGRGRALFVGDPCQPEGTIVSTPDGPKKIEDLREGDLVVSCDVRSSAFIQKGKRITGITKKPYKDDLVVADAGDRRSRYTLNHRCVVRFSGLREKWCVYMQRRGDQYRVGKAAMDYGSVSGPVARARAEGADALWILDVFGVEADAFEAEAMVSAVYGIPQLRFVDNFGSAMLPQVALDRIWAAVGSNQPFASAALRHFGRQQRWPLFDFENPEHSFSSGAQMSLKRPIIVRACNLISGVEMLRYEGRCHYRIDQWTPVEISREPYFGFVYSMDVDKYEVYVADGLLTHNCQAIYGFAGADADSFAAIIDEFECAELPLSVCYRCPTSVLDLAREIVPQIEAAPGAPEGVVRSSTTDAFIDEARRGDMVLCRLNAPLLSIAFKLIAAGTSACVRGRADLGEGLAKVIDRCSKTHSFADLGLALDDWEDREKAGARKRYGKRSEDALLARFEAIADQATCIRVIWESSNARSAADLKRAIDRLFADKDPKVVLSSVHRAKGLEAPRVFIAMPDRLGQALPNSLPWMVEQEEHLKYVAYTRAMSELIFLDGEAPERDEEPEGSEADDDSPFTPQADVDAFNSIIDRDIKPDNSAPPALPPVADDAPDTYDPRSAAARVALARRLDAEMRAQGFQVNSEASKRAGETVYTRDHGGLTCKVYSTIVGGEVRGVGKDAIRVALVRGDQGVGSSRRVNRVGKIANIIERVQSRIGVVGKSIAMTKAKVDEDLRLGGSDQDLADFTMDEQGDGPELLPTEDSIRRAGLTLASGKNFMRDGEVSDRDLADARFDGEVQ